MTTALLLSAFAPGCGSAAGSPRVPADAPNVLLVTIDTLRADRLGFYGHTRPTSPSLDAFASGAVVFEAAEASASWTLPALASLITSEHVSTHGCTNFGSVLDESFATLAERLLAAGYDTACVVSHIYTSTRHGLQQGVVHTDDSYAFPEVDPAQSVTSQVISDKGIRFLDQKRASPDRAPWFLWLHYFDPHEDYVQHAGISADFMTEGERTSHQVFGDAYEGEIRYTDQHIGRVFTALEERGFAPNTVVVVVADHGEEFGDHGGLGHGHTLHGELVRVPLVIRAPDIAPRRVSEVVRVVDVLPTLLELVGLSPPAGIAGESLVPAMRGAPASERPAFSELDSGLYHFEALRRGRFKLLRSRTDETTRLYDVELDPGETEDVSAAHPDVVQALSDELDRLEHAAAERARLFGSSRELSLTPGQSADLEALGYGGGAAPPKEEEEAGR